MSFSFRAKIMSVPCDCESGPCGSGHWKAVEGSRAYWNGIRVPSRLALRYWNRGLREIVREGDAIH